MIHYDPAIRSFTIVPTWRRRLALAFLLLLVAAGALRVWQTHARNVALNAFRLEKMTAETAGARRADRYKDLWRSRLLPSRVALEKEFNGGKPFVLDRAGDVRVKEPFGTAGTFFQFRLRFKGDMWMGFYGYGVVVVPPAPRPFDQFTEKVCTLLASRNTGIVPALWIVLLITTLTWPRLRAVTVDFLMATALITFTACLVSPQYSLTLHDIFSNDMLFWGTCIVFISSVAYVVIHGDVRKYCRAFRTAGRCLCGYDLTGNVSGTCPECGAPVSPPQCPRAALAAFDES